MTPTVPEGEEDLWIVADPEVLWQQQVNDHFWENIGQPACLFQEEWSELFGNTCDNITAHVSFSRWEFTGLTATKMTRNDELPRRLIPDSEWPRFLQATVAEWTAVLDTSPVTIISPTAAGDIRTHLRSQNGSFENVHREKPCEGVGAAAKSKMSVVCPRPS